MAVAERDGWVERLCGGACEWRGDSSGSVSFHRQMVEYSYRVKRGASFVWYVQAVWRATVQADSVGQPALMNGKPFPSSSGRHHGMCRLESDVCTAKAVRPLKRIRFV